MAKIANTEQNIIKIIKNFNINNLSPKIFIYGKENLLKKQFVDKIKESVNGDVHFLWGDETSFKELKEIFGSSSLFSNGNVVILWNVDSFVSNLGKDNYKDFVKFIENLNLPDRIILVSLKDKILSKEPFKSLTKVVEIINSPSLTPSAFATSIKKKIEKEGKKIDDETLRYLFSKLKNNLYYAKQEIEKLLIYAKDKENITKEDIDAVVIPKIEENVFAFIDRFFKKDKNAVKIFKNLIETSHHPFEIQSLILTQANKLLMYKTLLEQGKTPEAIFSQMKISYPPQKASIQKLSAYFSKEELINLIKDLYELEIKQKVYYEDLTKSSLNFIAKRVLV